MKNVRPSSGEATTQGSMNPFVDLAYLSEPFTYAVEIQRRTRHNSAYTTRRELNAGFCEYLRSKWLYQMRLEEIDRNTIEGFVRFLEKKRVVNRTKYQMFRKLPIVLKIMATDPQWYAEARRILDIVSDFHPWEGDGGRGTPTPRLSLERLGSIQAACEASCLDAEARLRALPDVISNGRAHFEKDGATKKALSRIDVCIYLWVQEFGVNCIPPGYHHTYNRSPLSRSLMIVKKRRVCKWVYPTQEELIPFIVLLVIAFGANIETILDLSIHDISNKTAFGKSFVSIRGRKLRSKTQPIFNAQSSTKLKLNVERIIEIVISYTSRIRSSSGSHSSDLWLCVCDARDRPTSLKQSGEDQKFRTSRLGYALRAFCKRASIQPFTWRELRKTVHDEFAFRRKDVMRAADVAQHQSPSTTVEHYMSSKTREAQMEVLGQVLEQRERLLFGNKAIDPRMRSNRQSRLAATPGFLCLDPYASPYSNTGKLCSAYGRCPLCPNHLADVSLPENVAAYKALMSRYLEAGLANPASWISTWSSAFRQLEAVLGEVASEVSELADQIVIPMLPVD